MRKVCDIVSRITNNKPKVIIGKNHEYWISNEWRSKSIEDFTDSEKEAQIKEI